MLKFNEIYLVVVFPIENKTTDKRANPNPTIIF